MLNTMQFCLLMFGVSGMALTAWVAVSWINKNKSPGEKSPVVTAARDTFERAAAKILPPPLPDPVSESQAAFAAVQKLRALMLDRGVKDAEVDPHVQFFVVNLMKPPVPSVTPAK